MTYRQRREQRKRQLMDRTALTLVERGRGLWTAAEVRQGMMGSPDPARVLASLRRLQRAGKVAAIDGRWRLVEPAG